MYRDRVAALMHHSACCTLQILLCIFLAALGHQQPTQALLHGSEECATQLLRSPSAVAYIKQHS